MNFKYLFTRLLALSLILILPSIALAAAKSDIYVVTMDINGNSNYLKSYGDGTFSEQEFIGNPGVTYQWSMASGIGDFDDDRDFDYLIAKGFSAGSVYLFERQGQGSDKSFKDPVEIASWTAPPGGVYPIGMAIADFNGDETLDFLITYFGSTDGTMFLGIPPEDREDKNTLEFALPYVVEGIAPAYSNNADAADFNNDGFADFVVAHAYHGKFSINIGLDDGTFESHQLEAYSHGNYWNIALADFDKDGNVDMIASNNDYIDFYEGQGDVEVGETQFIWRHRIEDDNMLDSAIDNFDFDGDGNQDLIVAKYGDELSVAVLLGEGDGKTFTWDGKKYGGGEGSDRWSIAAPSAYGPENIPPVAAIDFEGPPIIAGQPVLFDGSGSFDDDGEIVSYVWNFGANDYTAAGYSAQSSSLESDTNEGIAAQHVFYESGEHIVTLTVTDDQGESHCAQVKITVEPLSVRVKIKPRTLNLKSKGKWIKATIILPKKKKGFGVDMTGMFTADEDAFLGYAVADYGYGFLGNFIKKYKKGRRYIKVRFDRQEIIKGLKDRNGKVRLRIDGRIMIDGQPTDFSGYGKIKVKQPKPKKKSKFLSYYKKYKSSKSCKKK